MTPSRRTLLTGGGALAAVATATSIGLVAADRWMADAARMAPAHSDIVMLHTGTVSASTLERVLRRKARPVRLTTHRLAGLSAADFGPLRAVLAGGGGRRLFAVVDDAQALVVETLLSRSVLNRRSIDIGPGRRGMILLTGTIQE